ncbi:MAG TPA: YidB family protein [Chthoniobacterales bacterium]|nr:YidB family protein [Chthoniobacterales bacterium]
MGMLDSVIGAMSGKTGEAGGANALIGMVGSLIQQNGGLQGLADKFSQTGAGGAFSSWVGTGQNQPISSTQIQQALGSDQVKAIAAKMGIDPAQASTILAQYLPKVVDKLTPQGQIDPNANHQQALADLVPSLLQGVFGGGNKPA